MTKSMKENFMKKRDIMNTLGYELTNATICSKYSTKQENSVAHYPTMWIVWTI